MTTKVDAQGRKSINIEPHYCGLYAKAVAEVKHLVPKEQGQEFIVMMLEFGGRMYNHYKCEDCECRCEGCYASTI